MSNAKEIAVAILCITLASAIAMFATAQLDGSGWAESVRANALAGTKGDHGYPFPKHGEAVSPLIAIARIGGSILKIMLALGVPGLITLGILRITRRKRKPPSGEPVQN